MGKTPRRKADRDTRADLAGMLGSAEEQFPGILELFRAYGNYEETVLLVQQYLEATQPQSPIMTSNQSCPVM